MKKDIKTIDRIFSYINRRTSVDEIPKGWLSSKQLADKFGISERQLVRLIARLKSLDKVESKMFRCIVGNGRIRHKVHYLLDKSFCKEVGLTL